MDRKRPTAKVASGGFIQVDIAEPPGCLARTEAWLRRAAGYAVVFGVGFVAGVVMAWIN